MIQLDKIADRIGWDLTENVLTNVERLSGSKDALLLYGLGAYNHYCPQRRHQHYLHYIARTEAIYEWLRLRLGAEEDTGGYFRFVRKFRAGQLATYRIYRPDRYIGHRAPEYTDHGTPVVDLDSLLESIKANQKRPAVVGTAVIKELTNLQQMRKRYAKTV